MAVVTAIEKGLEVHCGNCAVFFYSGLNLAGDGVAAHRHHRLGHAQPHSDGGSRFARQRVVNDIPDVQVRARVISALAPRIGRIAEVEGAAA